MMKSWQKIIIGLGLIGLISNSKPITADVLRTAFSLSDHLQEIISGLQEEWEDIVAEAHFNHFKDSIDKDIAQTKGETAGEQ